MNIWKSAHSYYSLWKYLLKPQCDKTIHTRVAKVKKTFNIVLTTAWSHQNPVQYSWECEWLSLELLDSAFYRWGSTDPMCISSIPKCTWRRQESICLADPEWQLLSCSSVVERMRKFSYFHTMELHINEHEECTPTRKI